MNENEFITLIDNRKGHNDHLRHDFIFVLLEKEHSKWSNIIRALILGDDDIFIYIPYLKEKLRYCRDHPKNPEKFLDYKRTQIFKALQIK